MWRGPTGSDRNRFLWGKGGGADGGGFGCKEKLRLELRAEPWRLKILSTNSRAAAQNDNFGADMTDTHACT